MQSDLQTQSIFGSCEVVKVMTGTITWTESERAHRGVVTLYVTMRAPQENIIALWLFYGGHRLNIHVWRC